MPASKILPRLLFKIRNHMRLHSEFYRSGDEVLMRDFCEERLYQREKNRWKASASSLLGDHKKAKQQSSDWSGYYAGLAIMTRERRPSRQDFTTYRCLRTATDELMEEAIQKPDDESRLKAFLRVAVLIWFEDVSDLTGLLWKDKPWGLKKNGMEVPPFDQSRGLVQKMLFRGKGAKRFTEAVGNSWQLLQTVSEADGAGGGEAGTNGGNKGAGNSRRTPRRHRQRPPNSKLTAKQLEAVEAFGKFECNYVQAAKNLGISRAAAKDRIEGAYKKLGESVPTKPKSRPLPTDANGQVQLRKSGNSYTPTGLTTSKKRPSED